MITWKNLSRKKVFSGESTTGVVAQGPAAAEHVLRRSLGTLDLTSLGVAAIIGAGIFSTIGNAAAAGGPAIVFLFLFTAVACGFSALCYAEFASAIPVAGSAYTYAYASFGELVAWIIGWDLIVEYAIGNIAVAISWSQYFTSLLASYGIFFPQFLTIDMMSASKGYQQISSLLAQGQSLAEITASGLHTQGLRFYELWLQAPRIGGVPLVCDLPALLITVLITAIVFVGIEESRRTSNFLVAIKLAAVALVIIVGASYVSPANWQPFAPHGISGVLQGVSGVFFAYIGFDALSTTAEECRDPQRDLPRGMLYALLICTVLYILVALVLTGMVPYYKLGVGDPLSYVFGPEGANLPWLEGVINVSAVVALATVLLVFQTGQPRIWMVMSRDGLLPPIFARIHPRFKTPWFATLVTGVVVAIPTLFMSLTEVTDLSSIGTLFAFSLVSGGLLKLEMDGTKLNSRFKITYINAKYIFPLLLLACLLGVLYLNPQALVNFFSLVDPQHPEAGLGYVLGEKIPLSLYLGLMLGLAVLCFRNNLSLVPVLALSSCTYLMTELGTTNWLRFGLWLLVGMAIYFLYGHKHSRLGEEQSRSSLARS